MIYKKRNENGQSAVWNVFVQNLCLLGLSIANWVCLQLLKSFSQLNWCQHLTNSLPELQGWQCSRPEGASGDLCLLLLLHRGWPAAGRENRTPTVQVKHMPFSGCFHPLHYSECLYFQHGWAQWKSEPFTLAVAVPGCRHWATNNWQLEVSLKLDSRHPLSIAKVDRMVAIF